MKAILRTLFFTCGFMLLASVTNAQIPVLNSYPAARATLYLDFDGQYVTGTSWNWGGPIDAQPASISASAINEIFSRVAEDYRPFNINITTDSNVYASAPSNKRMRIIITSTSNWYGNAGGVAYVGSFIWGDGTPGWVFSSLLQNNTKWVAEAVSHEAGHTLGLQHQSSFDATCRKTAEYSGGQGEGEIGWAPIMGVGYYKNLTTWHKGPNTGGCNSIQNDMDILASYLGYKADDHANNILTATNVSIIGTSFNVSGLINQSGDTDAFKIMIPTPTNLQLNAIPQNVGSGNEGANIDIGISILNDHGDTIGVYNPSTLLSAGIDTNLNSGLYYLLVKGVGNVNHSDYGSIGFYSLSGQLANVLPIHKLQLKGNAVNGVHQLSWSLIADEPVKEIAIERSQNGKDFSNVITLDGDARSFSYQPFNDKNYYRLKAIAGARHYYSNVIAITKNTGNNGARILSFNNQQLVINSSTPTKLRLFDEMGRLYSTLDLSNGIHHISTSAIHTGIFFLKFNDGNREWTERLIKY